MAKAFDGLTAPAGTHHARWVADELTAAEAGGIGTIVPSGFEAYARVLHRPQPGHPAWEDVAPAVLRRADGPVADVLPLGLELSALEGQMHDELVDALVPALAAATAAPDRCHYGLWVGYGWRTPARASDPRTEQVHVVVKGFGPLGPRVARLVKPLVVRRLSRREDRLAEPVHELLARCPLQEGWMGRDMLLLDGPVEAVATIGWPGGSLWGHGGLWRHAPQWWWSADRSWFVGTEIDHPWTYVGGSTSLVDAVRALPDVQAVRVEHGDPW